MEKTDSARKEILADGENLTSTHWQETGLDCFVRTRVRGLPWRSSGWVSELPLQGVWVPSLVGELRSCKPAAKKKKENVWFSSSKIVNWLSFNALTMDSSNTQTSKIT